MEAAGTEVAFGAVGEEHHAEAEEAQEVRPAVVYSSSETVLISFRRFWRSWRFWRSGR